MGKRVKVYHCPECGRWHVSASTTTSTRRDPLDHGLDLWRRGRRREPPEIELEEEED